MSQAAEGAAAQWAAGLFEFCGPVEGLPKSMLPVDDKFLPAMACCCPCVIISLNSQIVSQTIEMSMATKCITTCCCSNPTTEYATRRKLRFIGDIQAKGEEADVQACLDVLAVSLCLPCTIMQNLKEIAKRKDQLLLAAGGAAVGAIGANLLGKARK
mmetsp:Transcript_146245/g.207356  ORF Transcript_146245/g.207356 Transcript_146245/m.207356 type:complete len:157 (-) Transcript_146245:72-542(-)